MLQEWWGVTDEVKEQAIAISKNGGCEGLVSPNLNKKKKIPADHPHTSQIKWICVKCRALSIQSLEAHQPKAGFKLNLSRRCY